jgi:hypothetical protein
LTDQLVDRQLTASDPEHVEVLLHVGETGWVGLEVHVAAGGDPHAIPICLESTIGMNLLDDSLNFLGLTAQRVENELPPPDEFWWLSNCSHCYTLLSPSSYRLDGLTARNISSICVRIAANWQPRTSALVADSQDARAGSGQPEMWSSQHRLVRSDAGTAKRRGTGGVAEDEGSGGQLSVGVHVANATARSGAWQPQDCQPISSSWGR